MSTQVLIPETPRSRSMMGNLSLASQKVEKLTPKTAVGGKWRYNSACLTESPNDSEFGSTRHF